MRGMEPTTGKFTNTSQGRTRTKHQSAPYAAVPMALQAARIGCAPSGVVLDRGDAATPWGGRAWFSKHGPCGSSTGAAETSRSEEHTSELQSRLHLVCRL